jgi:hypothetical protein
MLQMKQALRVKVSSDNSEFEPFTFDLVVDDHQKLWVTTGDLAFPTMIRKTYARLSSRKLLEDWDVRLISVLGVAMLMNIGRQTYSTLRSPSGQPSRSGIKITKGIREG